MLRKHNVPIPPFSVNSQVSPFMYRSIDKPLRSAIISSKSPPGSVRQIASPKLPQDRSPRGMSISSDDGVKRLKAQIERLEKELADAKARHSEESRVHASEMSRLREECHRLRKSKTLNKSKDESTQTVPVPLFVPSRSLKRTPREDQVDESKIFTDQVEVPVKSVPPVIEEGERQPLPPVMEDEKENGDLSPIREQSVKHFVIGSPRLRNLTSPKIKASPKASLRRALSGNSVANQLAPTKRPSIGITPAGAIAKDLLDKLSRNDSELRESILEQFDQIGSDAIPRDTCLVMVSLLLEKKGMRHVSIPKVICSRILKSVAPPSPPSGSLLGLRKDSAVEFFKQVLEFVYEQERPNVN